MQPRREWEVGKGGDIIVREVNRVLILRFPSISTLTRNVREGVRKMEGGGFDEPLQRPDFRWLEFCGLQSAIMISMELVFKV